MFCVYTLIAAPVNEQRDCARHFLSRQLVRLQCASRMRRFVKLLYGKGKISGECRETSSDRTEARLSSLSFSFANLTWDWVDWQRAVSRLPKRCVRPCNNSRSEMGSGFFFTLPILPIFATCAVRVFSKRGVFCAMSLAPE
jgi:hypothetical protein